MKARRAPHILVVAGIALLGGCGGDGTGPGGATLAGLWSYATTNVNGNGVYCSSSGTVLTLTQQGASFSGSFTGGSFNCVVQGGSSSGPFGSGPVVGGRISGSGVSFDLVDSDWHNSGTLTADTLMGGVLTVRVNVDGVPYGLSGSWSAIKQDAARARGSRSINR